MKAIACEAFVTLTDAEYVAESPSWSITLPCTVRTLLFVTRQLALAFVVGAPYPCPSPQSKA